MYLRVNIHLPLSTSLGVVPGGQYCAYVTIKCVSPADFYVTWYLLMGSYPLTHPPATPLIQSSNWHRSDSQTSKKLAIVLSQYYGKIVCHQRTQGLLRRISIDYCISRSLSAAHPHGARWLHCKRHHFSFKLSDSPLNFPELARPLQSRARDSNKTFHLQNLVIHDQS